MKKIITLTIIIICVFAINTFTTEKAFYHPEFAENSTHGSLGFSNANAYPPGVGILTNSKNCLTCHVNNGPWKDDGNTIIDILDKETKKSLKQEDGTFLIETKKGESRTVLTIIGSKKSTAIPSAYRNAWIFIDTTTIGTKSLSKFAPGWDVNLPMSCRLVGDNLKGYEDADITSLPMTIQPLENAKDSEISFQIMLTKGAATKGNAHDGLLGSYFERKVKLKVR